MQIKNIQKTLNIGK